MSNIGSGSAETGGTYTYRYYLCKYLTPIRTGFGLLTILGEGLNMLESLLGKRIMDKLIVHSSST
ncbi:hypothetical protein LOAG_05305 [Loa loa]|uniref:Uncharacterized protein n=1 Tax=Loa loa TaxID=7209 RepID=A0A1S0U239_LOALO|nr:hypothetical protein LOAG_05305 [Loa loa]EFO23178.2 hypothetical protein LOAG_05305 [Loa loa]